MKAFLFAALLAASGAAPVYTPSMAETSEDALDASSADLTAHADSGREPSMAENSEDTLDASSADLTAHADAGREPEARAGWKDYMDQGLSTAHDFTAQGVAGEESFGPLANATETAFDVLNAERRSSEGFAQDTTEAAFDTSNAVSPPPLPPIPRQDVTAATTSIFDTMSSSLDDVYETNVNYAVVTLEDQITSTAEQVKIGNSSLNDPAAAALATSLSAVFTTAIEDALVESFGSITNISQLTAVIEDALAKSLGSIANTSQLALVESFGSITNISQLTAAIEDALAKSLGSIANTSQFDCSQPPPFILVIVNGLNGTLPTQILGGAYARRPAFSEIDSAVGGSEMYSELDSSEMHSEFGSSETGSGIGSSETGSGIGGSEMPTEIDSEIGGPAIDSEINSEVGFEEATQWLPADSADLSSEELNEVGRNWGAVEADYTPVGYTPPGQATPPLFGVYGQEQGADEYDYEYEDGEEEEEEQAAEDAEYVPLPEGAEPQPSH